MKCFYRSIRMAVILKIDILNDGEDIEQSELLYTASEM